MRTKEKQTKIRFNLRFALANPFHPRANMDKTDSHNEIVNKSETIQKIRVKIKVKQKNPFLSAFRFSDSFNPRAKICLTNFK